MHAVSFGDLFPPGANHGEVAIQAPSVETGAAVSGKGVGFDLPPVSIRHARIDKVQEIVES